MLIRVFLDTLGVDPGRVPAALDALGTGESTTDVRTVLASSYRALDPDTARVFRQLAQAPGARTSPGPRPPD
ncbi:hypothetical protein [Streptomyces sp. PTD5-9]|uniref:hypothetical protein n=1 Tax=Streptomyces sp. PTD5-9 TaxID=3120150 RepID=UPI003009080D